MAYITAKARKSKQDRGKEGRGKREVGVSWFPWWFRGSCAFVVRALSWCGVRRFAWLAVSFGDGNLGHKRRKHARKEGKERHQQEKEHIEEVWRDELRIALLLIENQEQKAAWLVVFSASSLFYGCVPCSVL